MITWHYLVDSKSKAVVPEKDISTGVEAQMDLVSWIAIGHYCQGEINKCLLTPDRDSTTHQVRIPPKSNLVNQCVLLVLLIRIWVKNYLLGQKQLRDSCITKANPSMGDSSRKLEHTAWPTGSSIHWRLSLPSDNLKLFQAAGLVWESSGQLSWNLSLPGVLATVRELLSNPYSLYRREDRGVS